MKALTYPHEATIILHVSASQPISEARTEAWARSAVKEAISMHTDRRWMAGDQRAPEDGWAYLELDSVEVLP